MRYLILTYYTKANGQIDESMVVARNLKNRDRQEASVILDFKLQRVEKCTLNGVNVPKVWDSVVSYYYQHYANIIERLFTENGHPIDIKVAAPA
jgi:uncharacterized protein YabN with tetrapyrrole methylase and pyrophosphatase domain